MFQVEWNAVNNRLPHTKKRKQDKEYAFNKNSGESHLPAITHLGNHRIGKESIQSHAGCQGNG